MKIDLIKEEDQDECGRYDILFVTITEQEALELIKSLSIQLERKSSNVGRAETFAECGTYFSVAVGSFK